MWYYFNLDMNDTKLYTQNNGKSTPSTLPGNLKSLYTIYTEKVQHKYLFKYDNSQFCYQLSQISRKKSGLYILFKGKGTYTIKDYDVMRIALITHCLYPNTKCTSRVMNKIFQYNYIDDYRKQSAMIGQELCFIPL